MYVCESCGAKNCSMTESWMGVFRDEDDEYLELRDYPVAKFRCKCCGTEWTDIEVVEQRTGWVYLGDGATWGVEEDG